MGKSHSKIPPIQAIFEKDIEKDIGSFTKNALFYQDILKYPLKTQNMQFKLRTVGLWILEHNDELIKRYDLDKKYSSKKNVGKENRFSNIRDRVVANISDLVKMGLLSYVTTRAEKVDTQTELYSLTGDGSFITYLLERTNRDHRKDVNNKLYELIQSTLKLCDSDQAKFLSKFYEQYEKEGLLDDAIDLVESFLQNNHEVDTVLKAVEMVPIPNTKYTHNENISRKLHNISGRLFHSLDTLTRHSQLAYIKSVLENKIFEQYPPDLWQIHRRRNISDPTHTTLYGLCNECGFEDAISIQTDFFIYEDKMNNVEIHCGKCKGKDFHVSTEVRKRPMRIICDHLLKVKVNRVDPNLSRCEECGKKNIDHIALRRCLICGYIGCTGLDVNHAYEHFKQTDHAVVAALSATSWKWCYIHNQQYL